MSAAGEPSRLAIIPARAGSKGLPGKNLAVVSGKSLVARAVQCALQSALFETVLVSTDDPRIAEEGRRAGAVVPELRPPELSGDRANILDTVLYTLKLLSPERHPPFLTICLLEPTSPMRTPAIVTETVEAAELPGTDSALAVSRVPLKFNPMKQFSIDPDGFAAFAHPEGRNIVNRQQLIPSYIRNGMCYAARREALEAGLGFAGGRARLVVVEGPAVNIDAPEDLELARTLLGS